jgi:hypothetical protein
MLGRRCSREVKRERKKEAEMKEKGEGTEKEKLSSSPILSINEREDSCQCITGNNKENARFGFLWQ